MRAKHKIDTNAMAAQAPGGALGNHKYLLEGAPQGPDHDFPKLGQCTTQINGYQITGLP